MLGSEMNLITTVIGFGMSITFIVFICTRLLCGRIRAVEARAAAAAGAPTAYDLELQSEPDQPEPFAEGLEPVAVSSLPSIKYEKGSFLSSEDAQCSICLGEYQEKEVLRIMPNCGHDFHLNCIDAWLQKQSTCPICRLSLHDLVGTKYGASLFSRGVQTVNITQVASDDSTHLLPSTQQNPDISESNRGIPDILHVTSNDTLVEESEGRR